MSGSLLSVPTSGIGALRPVWLSMSFLFASSVRRYSFES
nr:MAG TPA: hypothetical protein [Caudoviricetes sp.]